MTTEFDREIAVTEKEPGLYAGEFTEGWLVGPAVNGGVLQALVGNAIAHALPEHPDPLAMNTHYLSAAQPGPALVRVDPLRIGGRTATVRVLVEQGDAVRTSSVATFGNLAAMSGPEHVTATRPAIPPLAECLAASDAPEEVSSAISLMARLDARFDPRDAMWTVGQPSGTAKMQAWWSLADHRENDLLSLLLAVDALPPVTFNVGLNGWAPTLELTTHVRAYPAPGPLQVVLTSTNMTGGLFEEDCEVWDSSDRLVAQSRQLAMTPKG